MFFFLSFFFWNFEVKFNFWQAEEDQRHGEEIFSHGIQKNSNFITTDKVSCLFASLTLKLSSSSMTFPAMFFTNPQCPKNPRLLVSFKDYSSKKRERVKHMIIWECLFINYASISIVVWNMWGGMMWISLVSFCINIL